MAQWKNLSANAGDAISIPRSGRSLEEEMATHSSILAWDSPWTEEPGGLQSTESQRVGHCWVGWLVQPPSCVWFFTTPWTAAPQTSLSPTISQSLPKFMSIELVMPPNHLIVCHPLLLLPLICPASGFFPVSQLFPSGGQSIAASALILPKSIQGWLPFGLTGLISLLFKGLSRVFASSSKASVLQRSAFFIVQLSHPYKTTGKTIALTIWTFVSKVMSLLLNTLSRFVIAFLPRSNRLLIPCLYAPILSDFRSQEQEIYHCLHLSPFYLPWSDGTGCHDFS